MNTHPTTRLAAVVACASFALVACGGEPPQAQHGANPQLPQPQRGLLPDMKVSEPAPWGERQPKVPEGYRIAAIATDLKIPRQSIVLPNGDILVAEGSGGKDVPALRPKDMIAGIIKAKGKSPVSGGNRITLLRDADGDGRYELRTVFAENLNAPYGLAYAANRIYVANQDALVRFDYREGQTRASGLPVKVTDLPSEINHHWTKALTVSPDGRFLYVGIGSNSNITERGMMAEQDRAVVWQVDATTGAHKRYATGLRNPTALAIQPVTGALWAAVNERDEIGPNLVPDYITSVREGAFYGWPWSYWGQNVDTRAQPANPQKVAVAVAPDYAVGSHVAALGLAFSNPSLGGAFADGAFVGQHGSWNRPVPSGYKVIFVPFRDSRPAGEPVDVITGFLGEDGKARGRPVGVTVDPRGALIVCDDLSNTVWRMTPATASAAAGTASGVAAGAASAAASDASSGPAAMPSAPAGSAPVSAAPPGSAASPAN